MILIFNGVLMMSYQKIELTLLSLIITQGSVCSVLYTMLSTVENVQYCRRCSVLWRMFGTVDDAQYCGGCSALWKMFNTVDRSSYRQWFEKFAIDLDVP